MKTIRIAPSEIAFLWDRCPRCWYRKVNGLQRPKEALPKMFNVVDKGMKIVAPDLCQYFDLPVRATCSFESVLSALIPFEEQGVQLQIRGKVDKAIELTDDTFGLIELKMAEASPANVEKYRAQCHAYAWALQSPAADAPRVISRADMFFLQPTEDQTKCKKTESGRVLFSFVGEVSHIPLDLDSAWFYESILAPMAKVAGSLDLPDADPGCHYCASINATVHYDAGLARVAAKVPA